MLLDKRRLVLGLVLLTVPVLPQTHDRGELGGRVTDETGAVLPKVALLLRSGATGYEYTTTSGETGDFLFPFVPIGSYTLTAELPGFSGLKMEGIRVVSDQRVDLPLALKVGGAETQITVSAEPNPIETTSPTVNHLITEKEFKDLPVLTGITGRSSPLLALTPGASSFARGAPDRGNQSVISIHGSPVQGVGFYFDGIANTFFNSFNSGPATLGPNPDALDEFSVLSHTFKAEAGTHPILVHWRTKGGGNELHGQARAIVLHPALTARDFFDREKSLFNTYAPGFQLSGPVVLPGLYRGRDRTFFLADLEMTRSRRDFTERQPVLTNAQRTGNFSNLPEGAQPRDPLTGQPFPGGVIPASRVLPQSRFYVDQFIPAATEGRERVFSKKVEPGGTQLSSRVDHQFSPSRILSATLFYHTTSWDEPLGSTEGTVQRSKSPDWAYNLAANYTHGFSPGAVNSFSFGRGDNLLRLSYAGKLSAPDLTQHGYNIRRDGSSHTGFPQMNLFSTNFFDPGGYDFQYVKNSIWSWRDDFSLHKGSHALKMGVEARWIRGTNIFPFTGAPAFDFADFNPFGTGSEVADLLLGLPFAYRQGTDSTDYPRRWMNALYLQDDIKLRRNLTLNLGLRYELNSAWADRDGHNAAFRPGVKSAVFLKAPAGVIFPGDADPLSGHGLSQGLYPPDHNNLAPRFGVAFSPGSRTGLAARLFGGPGRTSIRAGYGIYYVPGRFAVYANEMPPWVFTVQRDASQIRAGGGNLANPWGSSPNPFPAPLAERGFSILVQGVPFVEPSLRDPYQHQWTLSLQRQLPKQVVVEVAYLGNTALHLTRTYQANPGLLTPQANLGNVQSRRAYRDFGAVTGFAGDGVSSYHGLETVVTRRFAPGIQLSSHYVWAKALDNNGGDGRNIWNLAAREATPWARANFDRRHQFVLYSVWELPGFSRTGTLGKLFSGWQAGAIVQIRSGLPLNIRNAVDSTLQGITPGYPDVAGTFRKLDPRTAQSFRLPNGQAFFGNFLFDPSVFQTVQPRNSQEARPGTLGRNVFTGPGANNIDLSLLKRIRFTDRHQLEFRADAENVLNHAQFTVPQFQALFTNSAQFGRTLRTAGPRRIQFVVRYQF